MCPEAPDLLLITEPDLCDPLEGTVRALAGLGTDGHRVAVQLRARSLGDRKLLALAHELRAVTRARGARLVINGRPDVALAAEADGVHLPERGLAPEEARRLLGARSLIGVSRHDEAGLARAERAGADYGTLSPFAASPGKGEPLGAERFAAACSRTGLAVLALGGVGREQVPAAVDAGAAGVAVIRSVFGADDPAAAVRSLLAALDRARSRGR